MFVENLEPLTRVQEKTATKEELVRHNMKFVYQVAKRYIGKGIPFEDLVQEGNIGLILAAEKFRPEDGNKFISFGVWYIRMRIINLFKSSSCTKESNLHKNKSKKIKETIEEFRAKHERVPTIKELSKILDFSEKVIKNTLKFQFNGAVSLNKPVGDDSNRELGEYLDLDIHHNSPAVELDTKLNFEYLEKLLNDLPERIRNIIKDRYYKNMTLEEVGRIYKMSPAGIKLLCDRHLSQMKIRFIQDGELTSSAI